MSSVKYWANINTGLWLIRRTLSNQGEVDDRVFVQSADKFIYLKRRIAKKRKQIDVKDTIGIDVGRP